MKKILFILLSLITTFLLFAIIVFVNPAVLINDKTIKKIIKIRYPGIVSWESLKIDSDYIGVWQRRIKVNSKRLCVNQKNIILCMPEVKSEFYLFLNKFGKSLIKLRYLSFYGHFKNGSKISFKVNCEYQKQCDFNVKNENLISLGVFRTSNILSRPINYLVHFKTIKILNTPFDMKNIRCQGSIESFNSLNTSCRGFSTINKGIFVENKKILKRIPLPNQVEFNVELLLKKLSHMFVDIKIKPIKTNDYILNASIKSDFNINKIKNKKLLSLFKPQLELKILRFESIINYTKGTPFEIYAPFHLLKGQINIKMNALLKSKKLDGVQFLLMCDLKDEFQKIKLISNGNFESYKDSWLVNVDLDIKNLVLQLPPIDPLIELPHFTPPSHIKRKSKDKDKRIYFRVNVKGQKKSVKLYHKIANPYLSLIPNLTINNKGMNGSISFESTQFKYLNRTSYLEKLKLKWDKNLMEPLISGRFKIKQSEYTIYINIEGDIAKPQISFESDPYLNHEDIIAVLLYGHPINELSVSEVESSSDLQAAVTNRTIGLLGVWIFASTPIQSVYYDPISQDYSATVKISKDSFLEIGTDWEKQGQ